MTRSSGWSRAQVALHWTTVVLVILQLILGGAMSEAWEARQEGLAAEPGIGALLHIVVGASVLLVMIARLYLRLTRGHPPAPENQPRWAGIAGATTHWALYALLFALPISGVAAWLLGIEQAAAAHAGPLRIALIAIILLHVAGALVEHFVFRSTALKRMLRPQHQ